MNVYLQNGFTLVEMVIVIAIVTIISAVAAPRFMNNDTFQTRGDADVLKASLRYAQKTALAQRRQVFVSFNNINRSIDLCFDANCVDRMQDPVTGGQYRARLTDAVAVVLPNIAFDGLGRPLPNQQTNIQVSNTKNNQQAFTIVVEAESGYIHN